MRRVTGPPTRSSVAIPMRTRFRGIDVREGVLLRGAAGLGRVRRRSWTTTTPSACRWLARRPRGRRRRLARAGPRPRCRSTSTVPAVGPRGAPPASSRASPAAAPPRSRSPSPARREADDVAGSRRSATRSARAAGCGSTPTAAGTSTPPSRMVAAAGPASTAWSTSSSRAATVEELAAVRRRRRRAGRRRRVDPPGRRPAAGGPAGGRRHRGAQGRSRSAGSRACLRIAEQIGLPVVVSSALETSVGIAAGLALAAALPELPYACGLATLAAARRRRRRRRRSLVVDGALPVARGRRPRRCSARLAAPPDATTRLAGRPAAPAVEAPAAEGRAA